MTLKTRLILSNIAMIMIPILVFLMIEQVLSGFIFYIFNGDTEEVDLKSLQNLGIFGLLVAVIITNGLLTYIISKNILTPVNQMIRAVKEMSKGNLDFTLPTERQDELGQLSANFEKMRIELQDARKLQKQYESNQKDLIISISHDLKTPITVMKGYIKGLREGVANTHKKADQYMEIIEKNADHMDHLIDELFLYSKLNLRNISFKFNTINLNHYFLDFIEELRYDLEQEKGIVVSYEASQKESYTVVADRDKLNRVITNIIQNSLFLTVFIGQIGQEVHRQAVAGLD